jgi:hypothetical protein
MAGCLEMLIEVASLQWQYWQSLPEVGTECLMWLAMAVFLVGADLGGQIFYHGAPAGTITMLVPTNPRRRLCIGNHRCDSLCLLAEF